MGDFAFVVLDFIVFPVDFDEIADFLHILRRTGLLLRVFQKFVDFPASNNRLDKFCQICDVILVVPHLQNVVVDQLIKEVLLGRGGGARARPARPAGRHV